MPVIHIKEYRDLARDAAGNVISAGQEPAVTEQTVDIGVASAASAFFSDVTYFIEIAADTDCHYTVARVPEATTANMNLAAGVVKFMGVTPQNPLKLAVIQE